MIQSVGQIQFSDTHFIFQRMTKEKRLFSKLAVLRHFNEKKKRLSFVRLYMQFNSRMFQTHVHISSNQLFIDEFIVQFALANHSFQHHFISRAFDRQFRLNQIFFNENFVEANHAMQINAFIICQFLVRFKDWGLGVLKINRRLFVCDWWEIVMHTCWDFFYWIMAPNNGIIIIK